jgi:hypothetical protein
MKRVLTFFLLLTIFVDLELKMQIIEEIEKNI